MMCCTTSSGFSIGKKNPLQFPWRPKHIIVRKNKCWFRENSCPHFHGWPFPRLQPEASQRTVLDSCQQPAAYRLTEGRKAVKKHRDQLNKLYCFKVCILICKFYAYNNQSFLQIIQTCQRNTWGTSICECTDTKFLPTHQRRLKYKNSLHMLSISEHAQECITKCIEHFNLQNKYASISMVTIHVPCKSIC